MLMSVLAACNSCFRKWYREMIGWNQISAQFWGGILKIVSVGIPTNAGVKTGF